MQTKREVQRINIFDKPISVFAIKTYTKADGKRALSGYVPHERTIGEFINAGKTHYSRTIDTAREMLSKAVDEWEAGHKEEAAKYLQQYENIKITLPAALMQGVNPKRNSDLSQFESFTNVLCLDIDAPKPGKDGTQNAWIVGHLDALKKRLGQLKCVAYCGLSVGGRGLFLLIPISSYKHHREHWNQLQIMFKKYFNLDIDKATHDISRLRFMSYDDTAIINTNAEVFDKMPAPEKPRTAPTFAPMENQGDNAERIVNLAKEIAARGIDITLSYDEWPKLAASIAHTMGESGREWFHLIAKQSPKYKEKENDRLYTSMMKPAQNECSVNSFYYLCKEYGLDTKSSTQRASFTIPKPKKLPRDGVNQEHPKEDPAPLPSALVESAQTVLFAPTASLTKAEAEELKRHWNQTESDIKNLDAIRAKYPVVNMLFETFDLHYNGGDGWQMTPAQFKAFNHI